MHWQMTDRIVVERKLIVTSTLARLAVAAPSPLTPFAYPEHQINKKKSSKFCIIKWQRVTVPTL